VHLTTILLGDGVLQHLETVYSNIWRRYTPASGDGILQHLETVCSNIWRRCAPTSGDGVLISSPPTLSNYSFISAVNMSSEIQTPPISPLLSIGGMFSSIGIDNVSES
jgi:hypothetical protein